MSLDNIMQKARRLYKLELDVKKLIEEYREERAAQPEPPEEFTNPLYDIIMQLENVLHQYKKEIFGLFKGANND